MAARARVKRGDVGELPPRGAASQRIAWASAMNEMARMPLNEAPGSRGGAHEGCPAVEDLRRQRRKPA